MIGMGMNMLRGLRWVALILTCLPAASGAAEEGIAQARDLAADGRDMRSRGIVMLVLYSQADCPWCERARREVLLPLARDPAARRRVVLREIALDAGPPLSDYAGQPTRHRRFAAAEAARFAPTLVVYGPDGRKLADPIVGFRLADFYAEYVNRAIEAGLAQLKPPSRRD